MKTTCKVCTYFKNGYCYYLDCYVDSNEPACNYQD